MARETVEGNRKKGTDIGGIASKNGQERVMYQEKILRQQRALAENRTSWRMVINRSQFRSSAKSSLAQKNYTYQYKVISQNATHVKFVTGMLFISVNAENY